MAKTEDMAHPTTSPLLEHDHVDPAVFLPENLLEGARRQKRLAVSAVPAGCLLDMDGELVERRILGCSADQVVFTSGGSESNNHALKGVFFANRDQGRSVTPWRARAARPGDPVMTSVDAEETEGP